MRNAQCRSSDINETNETNEPNGINDASDINDSNVFCEFRISQSEIGNVF